MSPTVLTLSISDLFAEIKERWESISGAVGRNRMNQTVKAVLSRGVSTCDLLTHSTKLLDLQERICIFGKLRLDK